MKNKTAATTTLILFGLTLPAQAVERLTGTKSLAMPENIVAAHQVQITNYFQLLIDRKEVIRRKRVEDDKLDLKNKADHLKDVWNRLGMPSFGKSGKVKVDVLARSPSYKITRVSTPMNNHLISRGILFTPNLLEKKPVVIVCPDADTLPEQFTGLEAGQKTPAWLARLLGHGVVVYVPQSVERLRDHSYCRQTRGKDRRMILYRLGYPVGRSVPGLDAADTLVAVDFLSRNKSIDARRIGMMGIGQGGMTTFHATVLDERVAALAVVDYHETSTHSWAGPFDRRMRGRLVEGATPEPLLPFLIPPRSLIIAQSNGFGVRANDTKGAGRLAQNLYALSTPLTARHPVETTIFIYESTPKSALDRSAEVLLIKMGIKSTDNRVQIKTKIDPAKAKAVRDLHFEERLKYLRGLIKESEAKRYAYWKILETPKEKFPAIQKRMRAEYRELVGEVPRGKTPINPRSELILTTDEYKAYRVMLDVTKGVEVFGHLIVPRGIKGKRPVVICQHGLNGTPAMISGVGMKKDTVYHEFGRQLAERGYVVFAPLLLHHNPVEHITAQARQASALGMMRIAMPLAKTRAVLDFLETQSYVDAGRIGYYGLSYGGYSAIHMTPLLPRLKVSVVSGNFNDWRSKLTNDQLRTSYLLHPSEDMYTWNILNRFTHPELMLMMDCPCAIEFGRRDGITTPEWTAYAWKQVEVFRDHLDWGDRLFLAEFDGGHEVHGGKAFDFVDKHLWPGRK